MFSLNIITDGVSVSLVSINVWRLVGDTLNITCNFLYCTQAHRVVDGKEKCVSFSGNTEGTGCLKHLRIDERILKCVVSGMGSCGRDSSV
jgi:hypothetical protein